MKNKEILPTESQIEFLILEYIEMFKNSFVTKIAPSGFFDGKKMRTHASRFVRNGIHDIFFWYEGKFKSFEVKTPKEMKFLLKHKEEIMKTDRRFLSKKKKHLKDQLEFGEFIKCSGHEAYFVCSVNEVIEIMKTGKRRGSGFCETYEMF